MTTDAQPPRPGINSPPGLTLEDELEARGMTQRELARRMGRPEQLVSELIHGRKALTAATALQLETALGVPAELWMNLEVGYRLELERSRSAKQTAWAPRP